MKLDLEKQMQRLEKEKIEKEQFKKNQMTIEDAPIKIKVEKKEEHKSFIDKIKNNFSDEEEENDEKHTPNYDKWILPDINLLKDIG
jgi:chromosome segregation ATPase